MMFTHLKHKAAEAFRSCAQPCHRTALFFENILRREPVQNLPEGDEKQPLPHTLTAATPFIRHYIKQPR